MTNFCSHDRIASQARLARKPLALLLLILPAMMLQAQVLKPSTQLGLSGAGAENLSKSIRTAGKQQAADFIVAVVNSEPVTNNEVRTKLIRAEQQLTQQGASLPPRNELAQQILERVINDKAQLQAARASGLRVEDNAIDNAVQGVAQQNQLSVAELRRRLITDGIAYSQFRSELRDELLVSRLRQREVDSRVVVSEQDVDQFLRDQENNNDASSVEINLAQILVTVPENATAEQVEALKVKAQKTAERARAGTDFALLANEFPDSPGRAAGGQIGLRNAERYPPLFVEATQNLRTGAIAGPVRSDAGFHILKVIEKKQAGLPSINITQTRARHILLRVTPQFNEAAAQQKLADIKKKITTGQADFATLARENSADGSAKEGGDLGWANPGMFVPEFEQVMNSLAPGQISDPLISRFGVHLIQVMERRETELSTREQRELAKGAVRDKKLQEAYLLWAQEIRGRAYVEYREPTQ